MAGLPTPDQLRERSLRCRQATETEAELGKRQILASCALMLAQIAEHIERGKPVDADVAQRAIEASDLVLGTPPQGEPARKAPPEQVADLERMAALDRIRFLRQKAAECRAVADHLMFRETRAMYRRLADNYDTIADREEQRLAGPAAKSRKSGSLC